MKAVSEIGPEKILKFAIFSFFSAIYHLLIDHILNVPPARKLFLQIIGAKIGKNSILMSIKLFNLHHFGPKGLEIGDNCFIGDETMLDLYSPISIEDDVTIAQRVIILTHTNVGYKTHPLQKFFPKSAKEVRLKKGSVIGAGSIILPGVIIGEESFVAAGSVVTKNVQRRTLVAGVPAKPIRKIV